MPPFTVASLQTITHSRPLTRPMPVMMPADGHLVAVHAVGGELGKFEEGRAGIEQRLDAVARQQLAARDMAGARRLAAAEGGGGGLGFQIGDDRCHGGGVGAESSERGSSSLDRRIRRFP